MAGNNAQLHNNYRSRDRSTIRTRGGGSFKGAAGLGSAAFYLPLNDAGSGAVNTTPARGSGSATFTRAGATATTVLSTGLISSAIAANTARSWYNPAPVGGTGQRMYVPGVSGAYASTPDAAPVRITGDLDLRAQVALADWTPAVSGSVIARLASGTNRSYRFYPANTGGNILLEWSIDGTAILSAASTVVTPFTDGQTGWVRVTLDVDNGAGGNTATFYTSTDGVNWTQLGAAVTAVGTTSIFAGTSPVEIGTSVAGSGTFLVGNIYRAQIYNGINGTLVADFDPSRTTQGSTSFAASTGETWTINGRAYIYAQPSYGGYLSEPASTNLVLRSEDFSAAWAAVGTPTRSAAAKTCGALNMDLIGDDSAAALEGYTQTITYTGNATKTVSLFVAQGTSTSAVIRLRDTTAPADRLLAVITWSAAGVPTSTMTTGTLTSTTAYPDGVWRIDYLTTAVTAANTNSLEVYPATDAALAVANTGYIYVGGVQSENAILASSYIATAAATVTRAIDSLTYPIAGNFLVAIGTAYAEVVLDHASNYGVAMNVIGADGGATNAIYYQINGRPTIYDGTTAAAIVTTVAANVSAKLASSWNTVLSVYINGGGKATAAFDGSMNFATINIAGSAGAAAALGGCIKNIAIWQRQLSDTQIAAL